MTAPTMTAAAPTCTRRTLARSAILTGVGLFTGAPSSLVLRPAPAGSGVAFRRTDLAARPVIEAHVSCVAPRPRRTVLAFGSLERPAGAGQAPGRASVDSRPTVQTVEHLLSALTALSVTDVIVDVDGPEVPLMDGSALDFAAAITGAGVVSAIGGSTEAGTVGTDKGREGEALRPLVVRGECLWELGDASIRARPLEPGDPPGSMIAEYELDYGLGSPIGPQRASFVVRHSEPDADGFLRQIAPSRTFCTTEEASDMRRAGLFAHLRPSDVLVIGPEGPVDTRYRLPDEPARHKVLDMIGDMALVGRPIYGRLSGRRAGHALNHIAAAGLLARFDGSDRLV